jgi:hypothetical protein
MIKDDKKLKKFLNKVNNGVFSINTEALIAEIRDMHLTRSTRTLKPKEVLIKFQSRFMGAALQNSAFRSRAVEIKMQCYYSLSELDKYLSILKKYLKSQYPLELKSKFTTQADRDSFIDRILEKAIVQKKDLESVIGYCDIFISDIDAAGWSLKSIIDVMNMTNDKKTAKF